MKRLVNACPRLDVVKRSVCIEGARMAFAHVKVWWAKMDAVKLVTKGPLEGNLLLSYKSLHLEAQQRLQKEGCVVDIT